MQIIQLVCAILLPWVLGIIWLTRIGGISRSPGFWSMSLGYGYILGISVTTLIMRLLDTLGLPQSINLTALIIAILAFLGIFLLRRNKQTIGYSSFFLKSKHKLSFFHKALLLLFFCLILLRLASLGFEISQRPTYPWDAWAVWAVKPYVWFTWGELTPFVHLSEWLSNKNLFYSTIGAWHYPETVPLIQLWTAMAYGQWVESVNNISWLICVIALALGFYGQVRLCDADPLKAMIFTYFLLSLPLLNTHVALAGYADLWMATMLSFAGIAFWQWLRTKDLMQGVIALALGVMCITIKIEGAIWLLIFVPAIIVFLFGRISLLVLGLLAASVVFIVLWADDEFHFQLPYLGDFLITSEKIIIPFLGQFKLDFQISFFPFIENLFLLNNWNILWYLCIALIIIKLPYIVKDKLLLAYTATIFTAIMVIFIFFFVTTAQEWATNKTSINRIFLHIVPLLLFYMFILFQTNTTKYFDKARLSDGSPG